MNPKLYASLCEAISKVIDDACEDDLWSEMIYEDLQEDMAKAAAAVFDASQKGQKFVKDIG